MNKPVAVRRFIVPAVLAGILGVSAVASAEEVHSGAAKPSDAAARPVAMAAAQTAATPAAAKAAPVAALPRVATAPVAVQSSRPMVTARSADMSNHFARSTSTSFARQSVQTHLPAHVVIPRYGIDGTLSR